MDRSGWKSRTTTASIVDYLKKLRVETMPAVPYPQVTATMSRGVFNPVVYRPLFECSAWSPAGRSRRRRPAPSPCSSWIRTTCARSTATRPPSWCSGASSPHEKILDVLARPEHYAGIVQGIREEFGRRHSPEARLRELIGIIEE